MSQTVRCHWCDSLIRLCSCMDDRHKDHWVDLTWGSRWCDPPDQLHQPYDDTARAARRAEGSGT